MRSMTVAGGVNTKNVLQDSKHITYMGCNQDVLIIVLIPSY